MARADMQLEVYGAREGRRGVVEIEVHHCGATEVQRYQTEDYPRAKALTAEIKTMMKRMDGPIFREKRRFLTAIRRAYRLAEAAVR